MSLDWIIFVIQHTIENIVERAIIIIVIKNIGNLFICHVYNGAHNDNIYEEVPYF
jgi:hypothetical protein